MYNLWITWPGGFGSLVADFLFFHRIEMAGTLHVHPEQVSSNPCTVYLLSYYATIIHRKNHVVNRVVGVPAAVVKIQQAKRS